MAFQKWLKANAGKTYGEAIDAYYEIKRAAKQEQTVIGKQFEYNTYIRDFFADSEFESHVTNFYPWSRDKLIIGKFCQIAVGVEFVMNDANHQMNAVTTFPFYTLEGWESFPKRSRRLTN